MIRLEVNGKKVQCPQCWDDVTVRLAQEIIREWEPDLPVAKRNRIKLFSILIGESFAAILESTDYKLEGMLYECTRFVYEEDSDFTSLPVPKVLKIGERFVTIPKDLGKLTIGQNIHIRQAMAGVQNTTEILSRVAAIYLQKHYDAQLVNDKLVLPLFDYDRAMEIEQLILDMPVKHIAPIGFFFLRQLRTYGSGSITYWLLNQLKRIENAMRSLSSLMRGSSPDFMKSH